MTQVPSAASRLLRSSWFWAILAGANCAALFVQWHMGEWLRQADGSIYAHDYIAQWAAGRRVIEGHASLVYDWRAHVAFETRLIGAPRPANFYFLYPPPFLLTTVAFARLDLVPAYIAFLTSSALLFVLALRFVTDSWPKAALAALAGGGAYINLLWVQNGFLTAALFVSALALLRRRPVASGLLFGALSIKPQLGLLIPFALIAGRHWRVIGFACFASLILVGVSDILFGSGAWVSFFRSVMQTRGFLEGGNLWFKMQSPFALLLPLIGKAPAYAVQAAVAVLVISIVFWIWRNHTIGHAYKCSALLAGSLLVTPYLYSYDATILSAAMLMLADQSDDISIVEAGALIIACVLPGFTQTLYSAATPVASLTILLLSLRLSTRDRPAVPNRAVDRKHVAPLGNNC